MSVTMTLFRNANQGDRLNGRYPDGDEPAGNGLLQLGDINYAGAFRLDGNQHGATAFDQLSYQEKVIIAMNNTTGNLLVTGSGESNTKNFGEFEIPTLSTSTTLTDLNIGASTQDFVNVIDQLPLNTADPDDGNGITLYGMLEKGGKIIFNYARYYDTYNGGTSPETVGVVSDSTDLANSTITGAYEYDVSNRACGWMSEIPAEWQVALGGETITGFSSGASRGILGRLSVGPSAFVIDTDDLLAPIPANGTVVSTTTLLDFPYPNGMGITNPANITTELWEAGRIWNNISETNYGFIVPGTSTYMCLGFDGGFTSGIGYKLHNNNYGDYDAITPTDYRNTYYLFNVNDMVRVKNGELNSYDMLPYASGTFSSPIFGEGSNDRRISGATYDAATGRLYLAVTNGDDSQGFGFFNQPLFLAYTFDV